MKTLLEQIKEVIEASEKFTSLSDEYVTKKFIDKDTDKEYTSLEAAFNEGVKDLSNFEKIETKIHPKIELNKMIDNRVLKTDDFKLISKFCELAKHLDIVKDLERKRTRLHNYKSRAKKQNDKHKLEKIQKQLNNLNKRKKELLG